MSASIGSKVGILPKFLADLAGPLGDRVRRGLAESRIVAQLGGSLREIRDKCGVTKEEMAGIVPESWLECGLGAEGDAAPRPPEVDILAAHDAVTTNSRKAQHKLGKLVNQGQYGAHTASLDLLPETARPPRPAASTPTGTGRPAGGEGDQNVGEGSLQEPSRGRSHRMPSGAANGLATGHTRNRVRVHWKAFHGD